jgi:predicted dehydrogenase
MRMAREGFNEIDYSSIGIRRIGIGVLGYGFMGKVHSNAFLKIPFTYETPPAIPELVAMGGRNKTKLDDTAWRFGYRGVYTDWRRMVEDPRIEIIDNCTPDNLHHAPSIAAAERGKHLICEKPLAMTVQEAKEMLDAVKKAKVKHMCCHNYRFIPAVRLARKLIEEGALGMIYQFRACYLQEVGHDPASPSENVWYATGTKSGVLLGIGCHIIDMARFLVGEIRAVSGMVKTFNPVRRNAAGGEEAVNADEGNIVLVEFENGAIGTLESSGVSTGRKNHHAWEINGSKASLCFDLEDLNHLHVYSAEVPVREIMGFSNVTVTEAYHPLHAVILPQGHNAGWEYGHLHALNHFIDCVVHDRPVEPYGASFEDGYKVQVIMEKIQESSKSGKRIEIRY